MASTQKRDCRQLYNSVLCVGLTAVDLITTVEKFPKEDSDQRGLSFRKQRGGNASNACTVLHQLSTPCEYLGVLPPPSDPEHGWLIQDFARHDINITSCVYSSTPCPMATVLVSRDTGSRTIVFCDNGHPELNYEQFACAVADRLLSFSWVHFEMRPNTQDCVRMLEMVSDKRKVMMKSEQHGEGPQTPQVCPHISVEIEKPDLYNAEKAMKLADVVFVSKDWARSRGWTDMHTAARHAAELCRPQATVVCPWAEAGAAAAHDGRVFTSVDPAPGKVVDTLGAGDTFVAGFIHACCQQTDKWSVQPALDFACGLATYKCSMDGYEGLHKFIELSSSGTV